MTKPEQSDSKVLELYVMNGYSQQRRTQMNVIMTYSDPARDE